MNVVPLPPDDLVPEACAPTLELLQLWLDGVDDDAEFRARPHLRHCRACRERFAAAHALRSWLLASPAEAPPRLSERLVGIAVRDGQARRFRHRAQLVAGWAIAASVLLGLWLWPAAPSSLLTPSEPVARIAFEGPPPAPPVPDGVEQVRARLVSLTLRTVEESRNLIPDVSALAPPAWERSLDPDARPLANARSALAEGFEPLSTSARRAALMFWRELPRVEPGND